MKRIRPKGLTGLAGVVGSVDGVSALLPVLLLLWAVTGLTGCGSGRREASRSDEFFTSGSRAADQRAGQRMAQAEQLAGSGHGAGEKGVQEAEPPRPDASGTDPGASSPQAAQVEGKLSLFERLGGQSGIERIVADFLPRVLEDPRVNWQRKGVRVGGYWINRNQSVEWAATEEAVATLQRHMVQFVSLATGGPARYDGKDIRESHSKLRIGNAEFDAVLGDLKASLDRLRIPNREQKELLAIMESTRPQIVTGR